MGKKVCMAAIVVLILWMVMDFGVHGVALKKTYQETQELWRETMLPHVMYLAKLCVALVFAHMYCLLIKEKCMKTAVEFGLWFGVAAGVSMGYGSYAVMPIPPAMAFLWFVSTALDFVVAGLVVGAIIKDVPAAQQAEPPQPPAEEVPETEATQEAPAEAEDDAGASDPADES